MIRVILVALIRTDFLVFFADFVRSDLLRVDIYHTLIKIEKSYHI